MRIAVLADIHGNLPALEAAIAACERLRVDRVVVAGDIVVGSPDSALCWSRVLSLKCPVLRGNHERYVFDYGTARARPEWSTPQFGPVRWASGQFDDTTKHALSALPTTLRLPEAPGVLFVHGSPRNDHDLLFPYTPEHEVVEKFGGQRERLIVRAHNHYCGVREWAGGRVVTVGSVGLPLDGTVAAQFTILERRTDGDWRIEQHAVPYDVAATRRRFRETGYLDSAGPMARLYEREVATAAFQIMPFLNFYRQLPPSADADGGLARAVDEFLSVG